MLTAEITQVQCQRCGYDWIPRSASLPKKCPDCGSRSWPEAGAAPCVYITNRCIDGSYKIGASGDLLARYGGKATFTCVIPLKRNHMSAERAIHRHFASTRVALQGETFNLTADHIRELCELRDSAKKVEILKSWGYRP